MFAVRQVCEKYLVNGKDVFWAFMYLEKASYMIDRHGMFRMLTKNVWSWMKIVEMKVVQSFYVDSRACVLVGMDVSKLFLVNVGLRLDCVMPPWLFNVYMDDAMKEVNEMILQKWVELLIVNGGRFEINQLLFADGTAQVADSEEKLCRLVSLAEYAEEES